MKHDCCDHDDDADDIRHEKRLAAIVWLAVLVLFCVILMFGHDPFWACYSHR